MKIVNIVLLIISAIMGLVGCEKSVINEDGVIVVDVTAKYPKKNLVLQDFMDVEYIPLETSGEFICQGLVLDVTKNFIVIINRNYDGDIFIFTRNGKGVKKINRKGQGVGEYTYISGIVLDEDRGEMFVNEHLAKRVIVYDLCGNLKRVLKHNGNAMYNRIYNFDYDNFICYDGTVNEQSFSLISKQSGNVIKNIEILFEKKIMTSLILRDEKNNRSYSARLPYEPIIPYYNNYVITEPSSDTVYIYSSNHDMIPLIIGTPSIQSMVPEVFLCPSIVTDDFYFMEIVKKEYDFVLKRGFPNVCLMYDKKNKAIFEYIVYNEDYLNKSKTFMNTRPLGNKIATWQNLEAYKLVDAYKKGQLKGKLKEIAATLDEESNPVIMLIKYKNRHNYVR